MCSDEDEYEDLLVNLLVHMCIVPCAVFSDNFRRPSDIYRTITACVHLGLSQFFYPAIIVGSAHVNTTADDKVESSLEGVPGYVGSRLYNATPVARTLLLATKLYCTLGVCIARVCC